MENVITLGKLIELIDMLFLFCLPLLSILFLKTPKIRGMTSLACNGHFSSLVHAVFIFSYQKLKINVFRWVFSKYTEAVTTSLVPIVTYFPEICASLALLCGLK